MSKYFSDCCYALHLVVNRACSELWILLHPRILAIIDLIQLIQIICLLMSLVFVLMSIVFVLHLHYLLTSNSRSNHVLDAHDLWLIYQKSCTTNPVNRFPCTLLRMILLVMKVDDARRVWIFLSFSVLFLNIVITFIVIIPLHTNQIP